MGLIADQTHPKTELVNLEDISVETTHNSTWKIKTKENTEEWIRYKKKKKIQQDGQKTYLQNNKRKKRANPEYYTQLKYLR